MSPLLDAWQRLSGSFLCLMYFLNALFVLIVFSSFQPKILLLIHLRPGFMLLIVPLRRFWEESVLVLRSTPKKLVACMVFFADITHTHTHTRADLCSAAVFEWPQPESVLLPGRFRPSALCKHLPSLGFWTARKAASQERSQLDVCVVGLSLVQ